VEETATRPVCVDELSRRFGLPGSRGGRFNRTMVGVSRGKGEQIPWLSSSLARNFSFAASRAGERTTLPLAAGKKHPRSRPDPDAAVAARLPIGGECRNARRHGGFRPEGHPSGRYAELARQKLRLCSSSNQQLRGRPCNQGDCKKIALNRSFFLGLVFGAWGWEPLTTKRGQLYAQHGDFSVAVEGFSTKLSGSTPKCRGLNIAAAARSMIGELQAGPEGLRRSMELRPRFLPRRARQPWLRSTSAGQPKKRDRDYDAALVINPKHPSALLRVEE